MGSGKVEEVPARGVLAGVLGIEPPDRIGIPSLFTEMKSCGRKADAASPKLAKMTFEVDRAASSFKSGIAL
jgi:hypothetical protein